MDPLPDFLTRTEYGGIRLTGSRIDLELVAHFFDAGESAEALTRRFPTLGLAHVYKVIAFYLENRAAVEAYIAVGDAAEAERRAADPGPDWAAMRRKLEAVRADHAGDPADFADRVTFIP